MTVGERGIVTVERSGAISRRHFGRFLLRSLALAAGARTFGQGLAAAAPAVPPPPPPGPDATVAAVKGEPAAATRRAVELLGGMAAFVSAGQRVVVKPNIGWDRTPDQGANTHPDVVATVVRLCLEAGAGEVLVFDRPSNDPRLCYRRSGIEAAVRGIGDKRARIFVPDYRKYVAVRVPGDAAAAPFLVYEDAASADVFVNVPIAKDHGLCLLTMGMKNLMGVLGGDRGRMHDGFDEKIVALNRARRSDLVVLDATRVIVANGPQGGRPQDVRRPGVVVAGTNVVAVDAYATRFFGFAPQDVSHLIRAAAHGLGPIDLSTVRVREESL
jgi:uncharacterized protein (DUF362 family)